jgi:L-fuconolactonase
MQRRDILKLAAIGAGAVALRQPASALGVSSSISRPEPPSGPIPNHIPMIDTHIHLFDPLRPGGVPWPAKTDTVIYKPALPERYVQETAALGVVGAIAIEASPLATDNQWVLNVAANHGVIVGMVGDLVPDAETFQSDLDRLHGNALFLGIRYGNIWDRDLTADIEKPGFVDGLKALAAAGLVLDTANPNPRLIEGVVKVAERVPELRIVIDHLPHARVPAEPDARDQYWANLRLLGGSPRVFVKLSEIPVRMDGKLMTDPHYYQASLDALWDIFGEDRVLFGSDWPNSDHTASYAEMLPIVRGYMATKSAAAQEKYFWKNSIAAYRWQRRSPNQPAL